MKLIELLNEVKIDNTYSGHFTTGYNMNVDYRGIRVMMTPRIFLKLASRLNDTPSEYVRNLIATGEGIGSPFLILNFPDSWYDTSGRIRTDIDLDDPAVVVGHEGRNRMYGILSVDGNIPIEVHLFGNGEVRNRHLTPKVLDALNHWLVPELQRIPIFGPFFTLNINENYDSLHRKILDKTGFWGAQGAGCIVKSRRTNKFLIAHRSMHVEQPGTWGTWGGAIDPNDISPLSAAIREFREETNFDGKILETFPLYVFTKGTFKFSNFLVIIEDEFTPILNWEHQGFKWCEWGEWPSPIHFGLHALLNDRKSVQFMNPIVTESILIPMGLGKAKISVPDVLYHSLRGRKLTSHGDIDTYLPGNPQEWIELKNMFRWSIKGIVYLSQTPLDSMAIKIDTHQLNPNLLRYTGQSEGYLIYADNIHAEAIIPS